MKAIALNPGELMPYPYAGDAQLELGNYPAAEEMYGHLAAPDDDKPHLGLKFLAYSHGAGLAWIKGDVASAKDDLEHATALAQELHMPAENIAWTEFMAGEQDFQTGDLAAAETAEGEALAAYPRYHRALAAMGQIRAAQGRLPEAIDFYRQAVAIIPLPAYAAALGDVYAANRDAKDAEKEYALVEFIGKLSEINRQVFNRELAIFYADHDRDPAEALALAERELQVRHDVYTSDALAWALLKNHQTARAQDEMKKAMRMGTRDPLLEFHAGMIAAAAGDRDEAARHLQQALAINPHFHVLFADQARSTLKSIGGQISGQTAVVSAPGFRDDRRP
jgi:tetratricopeptide (TPR) repeat protein